MAASAVESVVFGPGVKLIAVASTSKAVNSARGMEVGRESRAMVPTVDKIPLQFRYRFFDNHINCAGACIGTVFPAAPMLTREDAVMRALAALVEQTEPPTPVCPDSVTQVA